MKKWIIISLVLLIFSGLIFIWRVDEQNLGDDYYYLPKYEAIDVGYPGGAIIYKSKQKNVFNDVKIPGDVIQVNKNKEFIIAIQNIDSVNNTQSIVLDSNSLHYFIIVKKADSVYGPFSKKRYLQERVELQVPLGLRLKNE